MMISAILRANLGMSTGAGSLFASMSAACARESGSAALLSCSFLLMEPNGGPVC
jgi:hypothetical protein